MPEKTQFRVIKTFDSPQGLMRKGDKLTFKTKKDESYFEAMGYVERVSTFKPRKAKPAEKVKKDSRTPTQAKKKTTNPPSKKKS